jgi:hypothetical protein
LIDLEEISWETADEDTLDHHVSIRIIEDNRLMSGIIGVGEEVGGISFSPELLECRFIIDKRDDDFSTFCDTRLSDEDEVS